ncbi:MAG: hypothetical protein P1V18_01430 [Candidatus Gracilibacteria bacterium]|nr:hypothetical protein [Candidatus Gracilibacteria bacterium]
MALDNKQKKSVAAKVTELLSKGESLEDILTAGKGAGGDTNEALIHAGACAVKEGFAPHSVKAKLVNDPFNLNAVAAEKTVAEGFAARGKSSKLMIAGKSFVALLVLAGITLGTIAFFVGDDSEEMDAKFATIDSHKTLEGKISAVDAKVAPLDGKISAVDAKVAPLADKVGVFNASVANAKKSATAAKKSEDAARQEAVNAKNFADGARNYATAAKTEAENAKNFKVDAEGFAQASKAAVVAADASAVKAGKHQQLASKATKVLAKAMPTIRKVANLPEEEKSGAQILLDAEREAKEILGN